MSYSNDDTQPNMVQPPKQYTPRYDEPGGPPRLLLFGVIGLFLLVVGGSFAGVYIFREVLTPAQRVRVIDNAPFMEAFLPPTPPGGRLPTVQPNVGSEAEAMDLLGLPLEDLVPTRTPTPGETPVESITVEESSDASATPLPTNAPATNTPTATPTDAPTATATPTATPPQSASASGAASNAAINTVAQTTRRVPPTARIFGLTHQQQTWNNCGPATITMALSYYGWPEEQAYAASYLKPNREDKNVSPQELVDFVNEQTGVRATMRMGGNLNLLKTLIASGFPVIVERGMMFEANDWLGHYQALISYDDTLDIFYAYDSFMGTGPNDAGVTESYARMDADWRQFNRTFIVVYQTEQAAALRALLGNLADEESAAAHAFSVAQQEAEANPTDAYAWFNMGTSLVALGDYRRAANAYAQSMRHNLPWRMLWYQFGPFEAFYETGQYDQVMSLVNINLNQAEEVEETFYWRGRVYAAQGETSRARADFNRVLALNPNFEAARVALNQL